MEHDTVFKRLERVPNIPTLPEVALKVNDLLHDPETSVRQLSETLMQDQAIVSNLLKLVNSSFYGFPSKIDSIPRAIVVLGFETVRNAIMAVVTTQTLDKVNDGSAFTNAGFWRHSIAVAVTSRQLSQRIPLEVPETCFVAGLLHDMGKVIMSRFLTPEFTQVIARMETGCSFFEAEQASLPFDHAQIGGYLAERWRLPANLINAITCHHAPQGDIPGRNLAEVIHAADMIVNRCLTGSVATPDLNGISPDHAAAFARLAATSPVWFEEIKPEIENACAFFHIP